MKPIFSILLTVCCGLAIGLAQQTNPPAQTSAAAQPTNQPATGPPEGTPAPPPSAPAQRSAAELEKLAMPIALHPDPLIAIILPASVYPVEVVQAARFVKDTNNVAKVDEQSWDENVKAVAKFPDVIAMMDSNLTWTVQLGEAFVDQPKELMDTIQSLRGKAAQAGTLQSSAQQVVTVTNEVVVQTNVTQVITVTNQVVQIQPSNPEVIYVPSYPPAAYYPPPGYVYDPVAPLVTFGVGMAMGAVIANNCDWHGGGVYVGPHGAAFWGGGHHGDVDVDIDRNVNINERTDINRNVNQTANVNRNVNQQQKWQPNQARMQTSGAGAGASAQNAAARGWGGASPQQAQAAQTAQRPAATGAQRPSQPSAAAGGQRPAQPPAAGGATRPSQPPAAGSGASRPTPTPSTRPSTPQQPAASRPTPSPPASRPAAAQPASRPSPQASPAFSGVNSGGGAHSAASRGAASRGGGGGGGRGGGGRR